MRAAFLTRFADSQPYESRIPRDEEFKLFKSRNNWRIMAITFAVWGVLELAILWSIKPCEQQNKSAAPAPTPIGGLLGKWTSA